MQALRTAASGMSAQQLNVEVISNNIANMNTVGYKRQRAEFQDLLYQDMEKAGAQSSADTSNTTLQQAPNAIVHQGMLESSNVQSVVQITKLIEVQRAYESMAKMMDNTAELTRSAVERLGKVN